MLNPTPLDRLVGEEGYPYFLTDVKMTLPQFMKGLCDPVARTFFLVLLMNRARPDDVFFFVSFEELVKVWPDVEEYLNARWEFWSWLIAAWGGESLG